MSKTVKRTGGVQVENSMIHSQLELLRDSISKKFLSLNLKKTRVGEDTSYTICLRIFPRMNTENRSLFF
jgi:hypothetical protein